MSDYLKKLDEKHEKDLRQKWADEGFDIELHKTVAKLLGAKVKHEDGYFYYDEEGKCRQHWGAIFEDEAWARSPEDWTREIADANHLFEGWYSNGIYEDSKFIAWLFDKQGLSAADRCRLFVEFKNEEGK